MRMRWPSRPRVRLREGLRTPRRGARSPCLALLGGTALLALPAGALHAQGTLRGTVHDSLVTRAPLAGATVVLHGSERTAVTDARGRFEFEGLAAARYRVGFFHPLLDSLDIAAPVRDARVEDGRRTDLALATPSVASVSRERCGLIPDAVTALVFGSVRAAEDAAPLAGAEVRVRWFELLLGAGGTRHLERVASDTTGADGRYVLCGVPVDIALTLVATHGTQTTGPLHLELGPVSIARRDLRVSRTDPAARILADIAPDDTVPVGRVQGLARLRVAVRNGAGQPLANAIVGLRAGTASVVTDAEGRAELHGLPAGSQTVVARAIGLHPQQQLVQLAPGATVDAVLVLGRSITVLPSLAVVGMRDVIGEAIAHRMRAARGVLIEGDQLREIAAMPGAWSRVPGVTIGPGAVPMPTMRSARGVPCPAEVWLDGMRLQRPDGWELGGLLLGARRVEVYSVASRLPPDFSTTNRDPCGAILIWTS